MLTRRGIGVLVSALTLWLVGRLLGVSELYVIAAAGIGLALAGAASVARGSATVAGRRELATSRLEWGGTGEVRLALRNEGRLPTGLLLVADRCDERVLGARVPRFVVPGVRPGAVVTLRYELAGRARGRYTIGPVEVRLRDPFGVAERVRRFTATDEILVHPRIEPLDDGPASGTHRGSSVSSSDRRRLLNTGDEFYTMREYVTGDDLRLVHWPSTAHRQRLMVRQHELPWHAQATLVCDLRAAAHRGAGPDGSLERAVSVTASLVHHLAGRRYRLRLVTDGEPETGGAPALLDRLAVAAPTRATTLGAGLTRLRGSANEGLLAAVVAPGHIEADARDLLQAGRAFSARLAIVIDPGGPATSDAEALAKLLAASAWRAVVLERGQPLAAAWRVLAVPRRAARMGVGS